MPFCRSPASYAVFESGVCNAADLMVEPGADHSGMPCDALSAAVGFTGGRAKLGRVVRAAISDGTGVRSSSRPARR